MTAEHIIAKANCFTYKPVYQSLTYTFFTGSYFIHDYKLNINIFIGIPSEIQWTADVLCYPFARPNFRKKISIRQFDLMWKSLTRWTFYWNDELHGQAKHTDDAVHSLILPSDRTAAWKRQWQVVYINTVKHQKSRQSGNGPRVWVMVAKQKTYQKRQNVNSCKNIGNVSHKKIWN